ncbi:extracellular solute-binding protein [Cohnella sp. JJ-181]|uniref:extracellular solute-binding protein n=1 Tax=Cohnella rhizoplanae TaxID=2974897 RepID=UPI00232B2E76|nr:extracellular solute-binding protein [Cohnella sp. JJ-181]
MIRKKRKGLLLSAAMVLMLGALSACSGNNNSNSSSAASNETPSASSQASESAPAEDSGLAKGKFDPPVTISTIGCIDPTVQYKDGETIENNVHTKWAKDELGIELKYNYTTAADQCANKIRLSLSANQKLPDVMLIYDKQLLSELIDSGKLMDVTEAFNQYASEQLKSIYSQDPSYWYQVAKDGGNYGIPILSSAMASDPVLWMRTDWMEKVGMQAPTNFDELDQLLEALHKQDPKNPPLALSLKNGFVTWMADASWIFGGYGVIPTYWNKWHGDKLEYGSVQPETKEALAKLQDWFKKGYISSDAGLLDETKASELFTSEKSGIIGGPSWMGGWPIKNVLLANKPDAKVRPFPIPAGPSGKAGRQGTSPTTGALVVSKDFQHMDALMLYLNKLTEYADPAADSKYANGWAEGYDYVLKDGMGSKNIKDFPDGKIYSVYKYFLTQSDMIDPQRVLEIRKGFVDGNKPEKPLEYQYYNIATDEEKANPELSNNWYSAKVLADQKDASISNLFMGAQTETMKEKQEALIKLENETFIKIVYNQASVDEFDHFVKKWKEMGGDQITAEVNEWYASATSSK